MDRCALFVDAGYLLAAGGSACFGTKERSEFDCAYPELIKALVLAVTRDSGMPVLRVYWYDAAPKAVPLPDHLLIAQQPNVKLRLGRLSGGRQKGVDSLIIRDLMTLARERAIATSYIVSGDEDIREAVVAAQDMGVRVTLLGIPPAGQRFNQAATLTREADEHIVLEEGIWVRHFSRTEPLPEVPQLPAEKTEEEAARELGSAFGQKWSLGATREEILEILGGAPRIPRELDVQLLRNAQPTLGQLRDREDLRNAIRAGFWKALEDARDAD
jgi:hypothetical protein